jgi:hypothetical protein
MTTKQHDGINWHAFAHVDKYSPEQTAWATAKLGYEPQGDKLRELFAEPEDGFAEADGNLLTTQGLTTITSLLIGTSPSGRLYPLANANAVCGVGATATAAVVADTHLGADAGSAYYQQMDSTYPQVSAGVITGQTTYASGNANFAWAEWGWASGTGTITPGATLASVYGTGASASLWNHKIQSLGTKVSGASWVFVTTVTLA